MNSKLLIFGSKNFNASINEIKEYFNYSLFFFDFSMNLQTNDPSILAIVIDSSILDKNDYSRVINKIKNKPILLLETQNKINNFYFDGKILLPTSLYDLKNQITKIITGFKFSINSYIKIKDYILDKNEKKIIKKNVYIFLTEREVQLIELLFNEKRPLTKNFILKKIWKYSDDVNTHTIETHIYRLRKKIYNKFQDDKFILNLENGYII